MEHSKEHSKWYIKEQCERIRLDVKIVESISSDKKIRAILQNIAIASYKIEADVLGKDLSELLKDEGI